MAVPCCNFKSKIWRYFPTQLEHKQQEVTEGIFLFCLIETISQKQRGITNYSLTLQRTSKRWLRETKDTFIYTNCLWVTSPRSSFLPGVSFGVHFGVDSIATLSLFFLCKYTKNDKSFGFSLHAQLGFKSAIITGEDHEGSQVTVSISGLGATRELRLFPIDHAES